MVKQTIVFLPLTRTNWPVMVRLARAVRSRGEAELRPIILLSNRLTKALSADLDDEIECVELPDFPGPPINPGEKQSHEVLKGVGATMLNAARNSFFAPILSLYKSLLVKKQLKLAERVLKEIRPQAIVVSGDRNTGLEPAMLRAANELGIVSIIPPIAFSAAEGSLFLMRRQDPGHCVTTKLAFKRRFPNQWRHDAISGEDLSYFGVATTYAYDRYGMLPSNPWVLGGGLSDWLLVDSDDVKDRYVELGVLPEKVIVTGHPDYDFIAAGVCEREATRTRLVEKYALDPLKKIVVVCLPAWVEAGLKDWVWHWRENEFLCRCASRLGCNVLVSLHPSQERERYIFLEDRYPPLRILEERLAIILPATDIYFTGFSSSTVPWAVLSAVPTVLADHYPEKDRIHLGLPGVIYVEEVESLESTVLRVVNDENYFQALRGEQLDSGGVYGNIDGDAMERIIQFLLMARPRKDVGKAAYVA